MKFDMGIEVRISQPGNYGNALHLGDHYSLELHTLGEAAEILVKFHELALALVSKQVAKDR